MKKEIKKIAIAGAGTMGSGIAQIFARHGYKVALIDISERFLQNSEKLINIFNSNLIEEGVMSEDEVKLVLSNISYSTNNLAFSKCDLIIEAIVEKMESKQLFWQEVEKIAREDAILATNTSGLSINKISELVRQKRRFIGMHFWNPPHIIPLVELIRGEETSNATVDVLKNLLISIEKEPVLVEKDAPGFIGNRLQFAVFREAMHIVEQGIANAEDVDKAMKYGPGFRYPVIGPLQTADLGGLDTFYNIASYLFKDLSDIKEPPEILKSKIEGGKFGVKSQGGFYDYSDGRDEEAIKNRDRMFFKMLKDIYIEQKID